MWSAKNIYHFYADGFKAMTVGRKLWLIIIIKLIVLFLILKIFFFPDFLKAQTDSDQESADMVRSEMLKRSAQ